MKWTKETCQEEALKYKFRSDFSKNSSGAYDFALNNKLFDIVCSHMIRKHKEKGYWTKEKCQEEALKYKLTSEFRKKCEVGYAVCIKNNWNNEICIHMTSPIKPMNYWTYDRCKEEALKYNNRSDFQKNNISSYSSAYNHDWLDEICSHMIILWNKKENCYKEALKYNNKTDFYKNSISAYNFSKKNGWLDEICSHMKKMGNWYNKCIYSYEFIDNSVYVGLTYNIEQRQMRRDKDNNDAVTKHIKETKLIPIRKQLTDYVEVNSAIILEGKYVEYYKLSGWTILNRTKTGSIGNNINKWNYDNCQKEALKYNSRSDFQKNNSSSYLSACKNNWLDEICSHMIELKKPNGYWNKKENYEEVCLKCINRTELRKKYCAVYRHLSKNYLLDIYFPKN
jgi:hypothetical protein